jgi:hypothetical protein
VLLGRPGHKWEDNIQMTLKDIVHDGGIDWINTGFIDFGNLFASQRYY